MPDLQEILNQSVADVGTWMSEFLTKNLLTILLSLLGAVIAFFIGRWLARHIARRADHWFQRSKIDSTTAAFLSKAVYILLMGLAFIVALSVLGVPMNSFVALVGAGALAIGLALQDSLANLASGILLIVLKPYLAGDTVEIGKDHLSGQVESVEFFHTALRTADNSLLLVPNREVMGNSILNVTEMQWRRVDLEFGISYDDDLRAAKLLLLEIARADPRVLVEPPTRVAVKELGDNSVNLILQPYVAPSDYLSTKYDLIEQVKIRFDEAGISFPFPQRTVYLA